MIQIGTAPAQGPLALHKGDPGSMAKRLPASKVEANRLAFNEALLATDKLKDSITSLRPKDEFEI